MDIGKNVRGVSTAIDLPGERRMTSLEVSNDRLETHLSEFLQNCAYCLGVEVQGKGLLNKAQSSSAPSTVIHSMRC